MRLYKLLDRLEVDGSAIMVRVVIIKVFLKLKEGLMRQGTDSTTVLTMSLVNHSGRLIKMSKSLMLVEVILRVKAFEAGKARKLLRARVPSSLAKLYLDHV